uniref:calcium-binding and coiled-coil domain-containing protein 2 n=1 Tax=Scatophagus argus TaxID=75038 RepID=UPI001ED85F70|nr:calcium-binding and coiled-coil domain-containing protein 2 [Scatophagus argus]
MESPTEAAPADPSARTFAQVVFIDVPRSYPPSTHITCLYTLTAAFQPNPRDWVGIFKVGWSTTKDYHTFVWVEPCLDVEGQPSVTRQAAFKDYYLPKDEIEFYQFCYVDSTGQVRGASTPFCFRSPGEQSMESNPDDDLLVITTQEQVEQSVREKAELHKEVNQLKEENESLKRALETAQEAANSLKVQKEQEEKSQLVKEMDQIKEQNENLRSALEEQLKGKELIETHTQEKYNQAVKKINQLKEQRDELRAKLEAQSEEDATLKSKIREKDGELYKMKDCIQLLQVDFQSSEKEKERLSAELQRLQSLVHNMADIQRENQELCRRLSQQETQQSCPEEDLRVRCQTLTCQLQDTQAKLAAARDELRNSKRKTEYLEPELVKVREQLESLNASYAGAQKKIDKQELQLRELHEAAADRNGAIEDNERMMKLVSHEKEELARENQNLIGEIAELRRAYDDLRAAPPAGSPANNISSIREGQQPETPEQANNLYENIEDAADLEEEPLVCRHCQERFPLITPQELEQHEHSHRICPFCAMVCDNMEQSVFEDHVYSHEL